VVKTYLEDVCPAAGITRYLPACNGGPSFSAMIFFKRREPPGDRCCAPIIRLLFTAACRVRAEANAITPHHRQRPEVSLFESASNTYPPGLVTFPIT